MIARIAELSVEAVTDGQSGKGSSKRIAMLMATAALSLCTVILSIAHVMGRDAAMALAAVAWPLAALGGVSYVGGKNVEMKRGASGEDPK